MISTSRWLLAVLLAAGFSSSTSAETFTFHHENVLGTSLEIQIEAPSAKIASEAEEQALTEIDRQNAIFSTYDADSEFSRWQAQPGKSLVVSPELLQTLQACETWQIRSRGAFNPAVEALTQAWRAGEKNDALPAKTKLVEVVAKLAKPQWRIDSSTRATKLGDGPLSLNAIAKGAIVDAAGAAAKKVEGVSGVMLNIGGDLRAWGDCTVPVAVANPSSDAENAQPAAQVYLNNRALATSGNYRRGFRIDGQWYSHIFDPRTGMPVDHVVSATAVAATASDADALATIFSVLSIEESQQLAKTLPDVDYQLIARDGQTVRSAGWGKLATPKPDRFVAVQDGKKDEQRDEKKEKEEAAAAVKPGDGKALELVVDFELNRPQGGRYRRPYVAIWLEDKDEFPVRTALLWIMTNDPGPRWHRDLLRWYRQDGIRKLADGKALIGTISSATRNAGAYSAVFDGQDDAGKPLPPGEYTLFIEVAREHGTYQIIRQAVTLGDKPIEPTKLKSNVEVKSASFEYRQPKPKAKADDKPADK